MRETEWLDPSQTGILKHRYPSPTLNPWAEYHSVSFQGGAERSLPWFAESGPWALPKVVYLSTHKTTHQNCWGFAINCNVDIKTSQDCILMNYSVCWEKEDKEQAEEKEKTFEYSILRISFAISLMMSDSGKAHKVQTCWCWALSLDSTSVNDSSVIRSCWVSFGPPLQDLPIRLCVEWYYGEFEQAKMEWVEKILALNFLKMLLLWDAVMVCDFLEQL